MNFRHIGLDRRTGAAEPQGLIDRGGTVIAIDHDLDLMVNADCLIDFGPGGTDGGRIIAVGTPSDVAHNPASITGRYLRPLVDPTSR